MVFGFSAFGSRSLILVSHLPSAADAELRPWPGHCPLHNGNLGGDLLLGVQCLVFVVFQFFRRRQLVAVPLHAHAVARDAQVARHRQDRKIILSPSAAGRRQSEAPYRCGGDPPVRLAGLAANLGQVLSVARSLNSCMPGRPREAALTRVFCWLNP